MSQINVAKYQILNQNANIGTTVGNGERQDLTTVPPPGNVSTSSVLEKSTVPVDTSTGCEFRRYPTRARKTPDRLEL